MYVQNFVRICGTFSKGADDTYGYVGITGDSIERGNEACNDFSASGYPQVLREGMHRRV